ncbi:hypothetical protein ILUMI_19865 [Ignelater luminosus]|uniref:Uncharacterized protein n=1 Tax=Ignelater luminosus TaxID=2038154 RepID=A0A8K0G565_IGNLU|nr:hypothetical protein ILUMI_19865 [Ignelater luminosus]
MKVLYINAHGLVEDLKADLLNGPNHVYNDHSKCKQTYCESVGDKENGKILELKNTGIYHHVHGALDRLVAKGHQLIDNETNNRAELYMSILCKFNAGKRLNLTQRGSFETRANISGLTSPGEHFKKYVANLQHQEANRKERNKTTSTRVKRKLSFTDPCVSQPAQSSAPDYGPNAVEPTMKVHTKGQWDNPRYIMERKGRLTASRFGEVQKTNESRTTRPDNTDFIPKAFHY